MPKIFQVNWFRKNKAGKFMWPGYAENSRVLKWIFERCDGKAEAVETPIGKVPAEGAIDVKGVKISGRHEGAEQRRQGRLEGRAAADPRTLRDVRRQAAEGAEG